MKSDAELLVELKTFATNFINDYNIFSYADGAYLNGLGDIDIDDDIWLLSYNVRDNFDTWIADNGLNLPNTVIDIDFTAPSIKIYSLIKEIK